MLSCKSSDWDYYKKSGRFNLGSVGELAAGVYFKFRWAWVRCKSLKRKVAFSNLSSIAMRIDYFNFYAVCFLDFMSTAAPLSLFMFCSHNLRCYFTLSMRLACASRSNLDPERMPTWEKNYIYLSHWVWNREQWDQQDRRLRFWWRERSASWIGCELCEMLLPSYRKRQWDRLSSRGKT